MEREIISFEAAIAQTAQQMGYSVTLSQSSAKNQSTDQLPAAIVYNSTLTSKSGVERCRLTTEVEFLLVKNGVSYSDSEKNTIAADMRCDALEIMRLLKTYQNIIEVTKLKVLADSGYMSQFDDIGVRVTATIVSNYTLDSQQLQVV